MIRLLQGPFPGIGKIYSKISEKLFLGDFVVRLAILGKIEKTV